MKELASEGVRELANERVRELRNINRFFLEKRVICLLISKIITTFAALLCKRVRRAIEILVALEKNDKEIYENSINNWRYRARWLILERVFVGERI